MEGCEVARFEHAGDVRVMSLVEGEGGDIELREDLTGPSTLVAYGEDEMSLRVTFSPDAVPALLAAVGQSGKGSLADYLADEDNALVDLMDLCDARGLRYSFASVGSQSGISIRR
ncbi:hypothetical protein [Thermophilibacter sp.]